MHIVVDELKMIDVGVCLFLFVRPHLAPYIKDFAVASVKTGMGGATGNKVRDRNEDFTSALRRIRFPQGRDIESHDIVFWFGDFNYRINLSGEDVKKAVYSGDLTMLWQYDQLSQQKAQGLVSF
ncbi:hypothetical protein ANCCEY_05096 [Ancylostoma ceylanicum]|uniref:Inositol polyphosphate-related phosphatase domain-containing protein n=1 Tax=Ancylostoma ceylanicum TaxID=53326 RepID=A0A0D6M7G6_9BILA|nr:hypothetical protein ANCCEY_05096 [Ancylostoma ceylanicum]